MTDKEFKQLSRPQLIDIIYQLQLQIENLTEQNRALAQALEDKRLRIDNAGNLAQAALEINECFRSAQNAADQYLNEIKIMHEENKVVHERIVAAARAEADAILGTARAEVEAMATIARQRQGDFESAIEAIMREYQQSGGIG